LCKASIGQWLNSPNCAGRKTLESVSAADALVDALEMAAHEEERHREHLQQVAGEVTGERMRLLSAALCLTYHS